MKGRTATEAAPAGAAAEPRRHTFSITIAATTRKPASVTTVHLLSRRAGRGATVVTVAGAPSPKRSASENCATELNRSAGALARARCNATVTAAGAAGR